MDDLPTPANNVSRKPTDSWEIISRLRFSRDLQLSISEMTPGLIYQKGYLPCTIRFYV